MKSACQVYFLPPDLFTLLELSVQESNVHDLNVGCILANDLDH